MKVWIVTGYNGILKSSGPVGVGTTKEIAERIAKEQEYMLDKYIITPHEVTDK